MCYSLLVKQKAKKSKGVSGGKDQKMEKTGSKNGANVGYEAELWKMADALRGSMDAAEYKHVVLGLIFLKYISDAFEELHTKLEAERGQGADPEDPDEYKAVNIFWVPPEARWPFLKAQAKQSTIGQLFYSTQIPACLWFLARDKKNTRFRDRRSQVLFVDARKLGVMVDRTHREFTPEEISRIATTYHAWRGEKNAQEYKDIPGFCKSATLDEIRKHGYVLTPGRYVGAEVQEDDGEPFEEKMKRLTAQLREQMAAAKKLDEAIEHNLKELGYGG